MPLLGANFDEIVNSAWRNGYVQFRRKMVGNLLIRPVFGVTQLRMNSQYGWSLERGGLSGRPLSNFLVCSSTVLAFHSSSFEHIRV